MSKLFLIPTPIGNLEDLTFRALRYLKEVDVIYAEDTRTSGVLLKHYEINTPLRSYHKFNEHQKTEAIVKQIAGGQSSALITDAGTPGISDPGWLLAKACIDADVPVETLAGATAFIPALVNSGLPCDRFCFEGFLPQKKGRNKRLQALSKEIRTMVFYESPYRIVKALEQMSKVFGADRRASVSREISKLYEETRRGTLVQLAEYFTQQPPKGEFVIIVEGLNKYYEKR